MTTLQESNTIYSRTDCKYNKNKPLCVIESACSFFKSSITFLLYEYRIVTENIEPICVDLKNISNIQRII